MYQELIRKEFRQSIEVLNAYMAQDQNFKKTADAAGLMVTAFNQGKKVISCGNGGSHCDAMHFAEELTGRYRNHRKALPAIAISNPSHLTCVGNDYGFDFVFSRYLEALGNEGDVLLGISTSGKSKNILKAFEVAKRKGMQTILLTGEVDRGTELIALADCIISVPFKGYADRIQEVHIKIIHSLILCIESMLT